jgi:hypothetical protein
VTHPLCFSEPTEPFDPSGGYGRTFKRFEDPKTVFRDFLDQWQAEFPGRCLPKPGVIVTLTGIPRTTVDRYLASEEFAETVSKLKTSQMGRKINGDT